MIDAIVLLGYSGVGKDTTFAVLNQLLQGSLTNAKFSLLPKQLVADILGVPVQQIEDRRVREDKCIYGLSPNDILTVLFRGCTDDMTKAHLDYAFDNIDNTKIPVFTDIRRFNEANAVNERYNNPVYFLLWSPKVDCGVNDGDVNAIASANNAKVIEQTFTSANDIANQVIKHMMSLTFAEYTRQLLMLNAEIIRSASDTRCFSSIAFGLAEELLELHEVAYDDNAEETKVERTKELGDVFAYATLLMLAIEMDNDIHTMANDPIASLVDAVADEFTNALSSPVRSSLTELALDVTGAFKRYYRQERDISIAFVAEVAIGASFTQDDLDYPLVLATNINKLKDRSKRGMLNKGSGNNR